MKKTGLILLFTVITISSVLAQSPVPFIEIDEVEIKSKIEQNIPRMLQSQAGYGRDMLQGNITEELPAGMNADIVHRKPNRKPLTSEETYALGTKAILMFGRYYNCGHCHNMHTAITASATVLTPDGICLTNYHVLDDIISDNKEKIKGDSLYFAAGIDGKCYPLTHILAYSELNDIAIFKVDTRGDKLTSLPLGDPARTGSKVRLISHPSNMYYFYTEGVVTKNCKFEDHGTTRRIMQISADFAGGSSGAAILDECGNIVSMVASTQSVFYNPETRESLQMVLKNTIPVSEIGKVLGVE